MKKLFKILFSIYLMTSLLVGCGENEASQNIIDSGLDATENVQVVFLNKNEDIARVKQGLSDFLQDEYGIDLSEKIDRVETKFFEGEYFLNGFFTYGENCVYINQDVFDEYKNFFEYVWIHETLHMLGFSSEDSTDNLYLYEVLNEALTIQAANYS